MVGVITWMGSVWESKREEVSCAHAASLSFLQSSVREMQSIKKNKKQKEVWLDVFPLSLLELPISKKKLEEI